MTSIHMNSTESQTTSSNINGGLNQIQAPSKYDEAERVRQRMDHLRRHHAESSDIHNRTQPLIDEQIHEDTIKYLKSNQVNGIKTKSQKPRAPKRQRTTANNSNTSANNANINTGSNITNNLNQSPNPVRPPGTNNLPNHQLIQQQPIKQQPMQQQQHIIQVPPPTQPQVIVQAGVQPMHQVAYQPHMQHPSMHIQPQTRPQNQVHPPQSQPHQQPLSHPHTQPHPQSQLQPHPHTQTQNYPHQQPHHQPHPHTHPHAQPHHQQQSYNGSYYPNHYQSPPIYSQQQHQQQHAQSIPQNQQMQSIDQAGHYLNQQGYPQQNHHSFYQTQPNVNNINGNHHQHQHIHHLQNNYSTLPNDLDLNLQSGLECDIDSLIKHEMSVEGQLDFNHDLLLKLDNHYQPNHQ